LVLQDLQSRPGLLRDLPQEYGPAQSSFSPFSSSEPLGQINEKKYSTPSTPSSEEKHIEMPPHDQASLEERETGSVSWQVYKSYARDTGSYMWVGIIAVLLLCGQAANVANVLFLGYWSANSIEGFSQGGYMAVYAGESKLLFV
jgi:ATP-binding cassette subfamily C (CFTR/MRP) protein 1